MNKRKLLFTTMFLSIAGILFAGYLTINKLVRNVCSFGESCPFLFGYPVCIYGLILFTLIFLSVLTLLSKKDDNLAQCSFTFISVIGVLFSGYYAFQEIFNPICGDACVYKMGLPTCVYGFIVFFAVLVCMIVYRKK
jgi:hypothetical protein